MPPPSWAALTHACRGVATVSFADADAAGKCVAGMHGRVINGQGCTVAATQGPAAPAAAAAAAGAQGLAAGAQRTQQQQQQQQQQAHRMGGYMAPYGHMGGMGDWNYGMYGGMPPPPFAMYGGMPPVNAYGAYPQQHHSRHQQQQKQQQQQRQNHRSQRGPG